MLNMEVQICSTRDYTLAQNKATRSSLRGLPVQTLAAIETAIRESPLQLSPRKDGPEVLVHIPRYAAFSGTCQHLLHLCMNAVERYTT